MGRKAKAKSEGEREAILLRVFDLMCEGHSVEACGGILGMKAGTLRQWVMVASPAMRERYWVARRLWGSALADEAVEIARESVNASSTVDKLKIDTFLRLAGKANPQEYGDKQVVEHQGTQKLEIVVREEAKPVRQVSASAQMEAVIATIGDASQQFLVQGKVEEAEFEVEQASSADQPLDSVG
jgi:predicted membrane chloride channel (bestrophin family)